MHTMAEDKIDNALEVKEETELHPAICIQGVERSRESVIGNFVQNRKCIRYQNTTSWNK